MIRESWINKLVIGNLKANRTRNFMIIISAAVISMVISTILNLAVSMVVSSEREITNKAGTTAQYLIENPSDEQIDKLQEMSYVDSVGYEINVGKGYYGNSVMNLVNISRSEWEEHKKNSGNQI